MKIAVQGCGHGDLNSIYSSLAKKELREGIKASILLICGDFQAIRNQEDLQTLACPPKYRRMGDFHEYWSGAKKAPVLTIWIGGNHEASGHMWEAYHGGWVAPNIYFLGYSGVVRWGGLRIAGVSGIHSDRDYERGYWERPPFTPWSIKSAYHTRQFELMKLSCLQQGSRPSNDGKHEPLDVMISHEWPHAIYEQGDLKDLLCRKPFFRQDIREGGKGIGSRPLRKLFDRLKAKKWFSAHMHVEFSVNFQHPSTNGRGGECTEFLALDKCGGGRRHLRIIDVPCAVDIEEPTLEYDPEWLGIIKATDTLMNCSSSQKTCSVKAPDESEIGPFTLPDMQIRQPPAHQMHSNLLSCREQTAAFCAKLGIIDRWGLPYRNPDEINLL